MFNLTSHSFIQHCGPKSEVYRNTENLLKKFLASDKEDLFSTKIFSFLSNWENLNETGSLASILYLRLAIERIIFKYLNQFEDPSLFDTKDYLFKLLFAKEQFISPELRPKRERNDQNVRNWKDILQSIETIDKGLSSLVIEEIVEDVFGDLYQDVIHADDRHETGEYYTPKWLINEIINSLWPNVEQIKKKNNSLKILDPSCGSGGFVSAFLYKALKENIFDSLEEVITSIYGFDINELSLFMTKSNFLLIILSGRNFKLKNEKINIKCPFLKIDTLTSSGNKNILLNYINAENNTNLSNTFDIIIGNPPWITLKSIKNQEYQKKIKNEFFFYRLVKKNQTHLFTQLEIAALFYNKAIDLYLKQNGFISFVMPKSVILGTSHNEQFQKFLYPKSQLTTIWDLQNIPNLFGMPTCVLFGKKGNETVYPVNLKIFSPSNSKKLADEEGKSFKIQDSSYNPPQLKNKRSFYYDKFKVGASIFPRNLYFIELEKQQEDYLQLHTDPSINAIAKNQWKNISIDGKVHQRYLFTTLLAWELLPFGYIATRLIILPIMISSDKKIEIVNIADMDQFSKQWFETINQFWKENSTETSKKRFPSLNDRLNYNNLLIKHDLQKYIVLYSGTGTNICSCVIEREKVNHHNTKTVQFIPDVKTWTFETDSKKEAHYLAAVLNSPVLNELIKPLQPQGLGGGRAIHRRPLQFPIQQYDEKNLNHRTLAELSIEAHELISSYNAKEKIKNRKQARDLAKEKLLKINKITTELIKVNKG